MTSTTRSPGSWPSGAWRRATSSGDSIRSRLAAEGIQARITGRPKHIYSIWTKMLEKTRDFDQIYDVRGVRIIVNSVQECYHLLGVMHSLWRPIPV